VVELRPDDPAARERLASLLLETGEGSEALDCYRIIAEGGAEDARAFRKLAEVAAGLERIDPAIGWYRKSLEIDPAQPETLNDLGMLLSENGIYEDGADCLKAAVALQPQLDRAYHNLAGTYHSQGRYEEALAAYERALDIVPFDALTISDFIAICNYRVQNDPDFVPRLHAQYQRALAPERASAFKTHGNDRRAGRRLRVGYVSPDFRQHSVAFFIEPVIAGRSRRRFEVYCYSDVARPDGKTRALEAIADQWRDISGKGDDAVVLQIRKEEIDILVDLDGHCAGNRLAVFARKPAPVQLTYLGYPATTGLAEIDYRLTDGEADPPDAEDAWYSEELVRIPGVFLCYRPPESAPPVSAPTDTPEGITFGSFNELSKVSPEVVRAWSRILAEVPDSKLFLKATALDDPRTRQRVAAWFEDRGVAAARIQLLGRTASLEEHLALYQRVDIALDTFPYNGTTTTCEALYMGVPVITLRGATHAGRVGTTLLRALELDPYITTSEDAYVAAVVSLAKDPGRRAELRASLRNRMMESPLTDAPGFVARLETIYLQLWERWRDAVDDLKGHRDAGSAGSGKAVVGALEIELADGIRILVPDDLDQLTPYVLLEQEDWLEDEIGFVRSVLAPGMRVLDVGANHGVYTLSAAGHVGEEGRVWSFEPASLTARWLSASVAKNGFENTRLMKLALSDSPGKIKLSTHSGSEFGRLVADPEQKQPGELVDVVRLDDCARQFGIADVDFVKLDAEGAEKQILTGGSRFFAEESPLVMFEVRSSDEPDLALVEQFVALGYRIYRLIPGIGLLAPLDAPETMDAFALNLFACKADRAKLLAEAGLLAPGAPSETDAFMAGADAVWGFLLAKTYSKEFVSKWRADLAAADAAESAVLVECLGFYVGAHAAGADPARRHGSLLAAQSACQRPVSERFLGALLHSRARIAWELGERMKAFEVLGQILDFGAEQSPWLTAGPVLAASPHFDDIDPGGRLSAWCEAAVLDQYQCLAAFSSYYLDDKHSELAERLRRSGFQRPEMERRRLLTRLRATARRPAPCAISDGGFVLLAGANSNNLLDRGDEDLAVADFPGAGRFGYRLDTRLRLLFGNNDLDLYFGKKIHHVFGAAIELRVALLPAKAFDFGRGHSGNADLGQRFPDIVQLEGFDDGFNLLHDSNPFV
jgi:FkbM family methyltransferase